MVEEVIPSNSSAGLRLAWPHQPRQRLVLGEEPSTLALHGSSDAQVYARDEGRSWWSGGLHGKPLVLSSTFSSTQYAHKATPRSWMGCGSLVQPSEAE